MTEADVQAIMSALRPVIAEAVNAAVAEAIKRVVSVEAVEGTAEDVMGRTVDVAIPGSALPVPATALSTAIVAGSSVVVFFYGNGRAFAAGPLPMP